MRAGSAPRSSPPRWRTRACAPPATVSCSRPGAPRAPTRRWRDSAREPRSSARSRWRSAARCTGIATAPIDKHALFSGGYQDPGHTELLARLTGARVAMMLASDRLRVVLATTHIALRDVPARLTREVIVDTARIARAGLRAWYRIAEPRIALAALNPHAGEHGRFGSEDDTVLAPAAREAGLSGPHPADTVFVRALRGEFDAVIAPYHDVGMTAIKVASFGSAVNVTLGLPWPRTSPDHGTAIDIAGTGRADPSSMIHAILECARIAALRNPS
ncbi:MAG TPA: 4-hydroxythreonine-4-phosphate dehydrogenase PdxA [Gemmatimonadaceae bacterium]|nr:4-hydroxythreonine-4-phosphate dehydrogenase PdxA [Gemmatimonadaceae bacterium]